MKQLKAIYYGLFAWGIASGCSGGLPDHPEEGRGDEPVPVFFCLRQEPAGNRRNNGTGY